MNPWIAPLLTILGTLAVQIIIGLLSHASTNATFAEKMAGQQRSLEEIKQEQVRQWNQLSDHESRISHLEGSEAQGASAHD